MIRFAMSDLRKMYPRGNAAWLEALEIIGPDLAQKHGITTVEAWQHFCAQVAAETDGLALPQMRENMHYRAARILQVFDFRVRKAQRENPRFRGRSLAEIAGMLAGNPDLLAETVYGGRKDLGNTQAGDGARYIGRGPLQTTGREWYARLGSAIGVDLLAEPELLEEPYVGWKAAFAEWEALGCSKLVPRGVEAVSRKVNGGSNGLARRRAEYARAVAIFTDADSADVADVTPRHAEAVPMAQTAASIAEDGSRSMTWLQQAKKGVAATGFSFTSFFALDTFGGFRGTLDEIKTLVSDHALFLSLAALGLVAAVILMAQHYLVLAARDGRYDPRKG